MSVKQRYQNLVLGDTVKLQSFVYDSDAFPDSVTIIPKVEIYKIDPKAITQQNPKGLIRKQTMVYRPGLVGNNIEKVADEFWQVLVNIHQDMYEIGEYVDRWYLITGEPEDIYNELKINPYHVNESVQGIEPSNAGISNSSHSVSSGSKSFIVQPGLSFSIGDAVRVYNSESVYLNGDITDYSGNVMTINVTSTNGSGSSLSPWLILKLSNINNTVIQYTVQLDSNREIGASKISAASTTYSITELVGDLEKRASFLTIPSSISILSPTPQRRLYLVRDVGDQIITSYRKPTSSEASTFPVGFLDTSSHYTSYGKIRRSSVVVGYFKIYYDESVDKNVIEIEPDISMPAIRPISAINEIEYAPGGNNIYTEFDIEWNSDPGLNTDLQDVAISLYQDVPAPIKNAMSAGIGVVLESNYLSNYSNATNVLYGVLNSSDNGSNWAGSIYPTGASSKEPIFISGSKGAAGKVIFSVHWDELPPISTRLLLYYIDQWDLLANYNPLVGNAWDDMVERLAQTKLLVSDYQFTVVPSLSIASSRPIPLDYQFSASPGDYYIGSNAWMKVQIKPSGNFDHEAMGFNHSTISSGKLSYEIHRVSANGNESRKIKSGNIDWYEKGTGMVRINTIEPAMNRAMSCFIVFFLDLPDGSKVRSGKIFFNIIDDLRGGALGSRVDECDNKYGSVF
jgi:hypothetical protein